jgi:hypothetical protein
MSPSLRHLSPKKSPARKMAMIAAFPRGYTTVSLTSPAWM